MNKISTILPDSALRETSILLARFAAHATGARAYSFFKSPPGSVAGKRPRFAIHVDGTYMATLEFTFDEDPIPEEKLILLDQMTAAIEAVEALPKSIAVMTERVAKLDVELAEIKISERARGLLSQDIDAGTAVDAIARHVEQVLKHRQLCAVFEQLLLDLEERVAERKLLIKAKSLLQDRQGISEEEAYIHLRNRSRVSRKRLREVAEETISEYWSTHKREEVAL